MNGTWLASASAIIFTPILMHALSRACPPRPPTAGEFEVLRSRYNSLELFSRVAAAIGLIGSLAVVLACHVNSFWLIGVVFGWGVLTPVMLIALVTLPRGQGRWREFWRFYELKYKISLRLIAPIYVAFSVLGIISTAILLSHHFA